MINLKKKYVYFIKQRHFKNLHNVALNLFDMRLPTKKAASRINCFDSSDRIAKTVRTRRAKLSVSCLLIYRKFGI